MFKARAVIGVCVVCALAVGVVSVQGAAAAIKGTTGFTCKERKEAGGAGFSDAHCKEAVETGAKFEHVAIAQNQATEGRVTNTSTGGELVPARLKSVIAGVEVELQANKTVGEATGENKLSGEEHFSEGTGKTTYSEVSVTKPAGKGCKVKGTEFSTNLLKGTSLGTGMEGKLEPAEGTKFGEFTIEGCSIAALNGLYEITGSIKCPGVGSTVLCTHAATTAQGTLKMRGQKAGVEVSTTATARANSTEPFTPLAVTTVETP
jgi:hypothetical protein